jgi:hypothetical protein
MRPVTSQSKLVSFWSCFTTIMSLVALAFWALKKLGVTQ